MLNVKHVDQIDYIDNIHHVSHASLDGYKTVLVPYHIDNIYHV